MLVCGSILCGVGKGCAGQIRGGGAFLYIYKGQGDRLLFRKSDVFAVYQCGLSGRVHQHSVCFVSACPDAVVAGNGGIYFVGSGLRGGKNDRTAGDFVGVSFALGVDKESAVCFGITGYIGAGKVYSGAVGQVERIRCGNFECAALKGCGALCRNNAKSVGVAFNFAACHFKAKV